LKEDLKSMYKIEKTELEKAFEKQMMLKKDPEYQDWAEKTAIKLIEYFENKYKGLEIEIPKLREKSAKSLYGKIKNLQIERLSKLYIIDEATEENKQDLYDFLGEESYDSMERHFFNRLIKRPFIEDTDKAPEYVLRIFNDATYLCTLIYFELQPALYLKKYINIIMMKV
jgi:hypothetical protein